MEALDLIVLGRQLTRIGEEAMRGSKGPALPTGPTLVLRDVLAHPGSSISEVSARAGLPQSYASESVARLREQGIVETSTDPSDGRRTLVRLSGRHMRNVARKGGVSVDSAMAKALGEDDPDALEAVVDTLSDLARRLRPADPGAFLQQLKDARDRV
jgi:DNA-binding MarR family transcriptional regulator